MAVLGWALLGVSILNSVFAFAQEYRAERIMEALRTFLPQLVRVRRDGCETEISSEDVVPGDILLLEEGNRIPADARVVESGALLVNNAPLTGESRSIALTTAKVSGRMTDSPNIVFAGCSVLRGSAVAVVFGTGRRTQFGKVAALSQEIRRPLSPLAQELGRMVRVLTIVAVTLGATFFAYGMFTGRPLWINIVFALGIIVANVPEGLLPTFTLALSMASQRMARKNVFVKALESIEALGAIHAICTDKTGTLTRNELAVSRMVDGVRGELASAEIEEVLLRAALIASDVRDRNGTLFGDPLDVAVARIYPDRLGNPLEVMRRTRRHFPFDLAKRREAGLYEDDQGHVIFAVKGAWESLRPLTGLMLSQNGTVLRAEEDRLQQADQIVHALASQGYRVIAVAYRRFDTAPDPKADEESLEQLLTLCGFLALEDPLRQEVPDAVRRCHQAGIRVLLVTGDHPDTAIAISQKCGILAKDEAAPSRILRGDEIERMREDELMDRLRNGVVVFARTNPEQKTKIVSALQRLGMVVGMTGDGVNDAPALKAADVGIAMGQGGTDVARESADLILLDNNFASIVAGIEEGRAVFANMQKFTSYVLTSNVPEILPYLLYIALPVPLALTVIQILSIDLGTDIIPAIGLGQEPPEQDTMSRSPRKLHEHLLSARLMLRSYLFLGMIQAGYSLSLFYYVLLQGGWRFGQELAVTEPLYRSATGISLATIILMQIGNLAGRRSIRGSGLDTGLITNRLFVVGIVLEIVFSLALLYWPPLQAVLGTGPVDLRLYLLACLGVPLIFALDYVFKFLSSDRQAPAVQPVTS
jgi:sodium/potassium-transporting ATPase subunit alpha